MPLLTIGTVDLYLLLSGTSIMGSLLQTWNGLTWISAWKSDYIHFKVWDEITYPFPNLTFALLTFRNGYKQFHPPPYLDI